MTAQIKEIVEITKTLPPQKVSRVLKFVRGLQRHRQSPAKAHAVIPSQEKDGDAEWERIINDPRPRPKLTACINRIQKEMRAGKHFKPLDLNQL